MLQKFSLPKMWSISAHHRIEISGDPQTWLTRYASEYRYAAARYRMDGLEKARFQAEIGQTVHAVINRIHQITGRNANDWRPAGG